MIVVRKLTLIGIYLVIFIDNLGVSLIIPMLPPIAYDANTGLIPDGTEGFRNAVYGVALGAYSIAMFFGAPLIGALSDSLGRKRTLLACLTGLALGYVLLALALAAQSLVLFVLGRLIGGFFSGSLPVAQAAVIANTGHDDRARFIGYIMFFVSLGYILGPLVGGYLSDATLVPWFNLKTPFVFVAGVSVVNIFILLISFREAETLAPERTRLPSPVKHLLCAMKVKGIGRYAFTLMLMLLGWNTFFQFSGLYLASEVDFDQQEVSGFFSWVGIGLSFAFLFLVGFVSKMIKPGAMVSLSLLMMTACIGTAVLLTDSYALYALACLGAIAFGLSYSGLMAQLSTSVTEEHQGTIMGMAAAIAALSAGLSGLVFGFVANISIDAPILSSCLLVILAAFVSFREGFGVLKESVRSSV